MDDFPAKARYERSIKLSHDFLMRENICAFPFRPFDVIHKHKWGLVKYSKLAKENNTTVENVAIAFQSEDGYTIYDGFNYTIAYNDTIDSSGRILFTLTHEIGHIVLKHLIEFDETVLRRSKMTEAKYKTLETEANVFTRNVLSPAPIINYLKFNSPTVIASAFAISQQAAGIRLRLIGNDLFYLSESLIKKQYQHFNKFIHILKTTWFCSSCFHHFYADNPSFCPICGKPTIFKHEGVNPLMEYKGYDLDEKGFPKVCPVCGNEDLDGNSFCKICGTMIQNKCTYIEHDINGNVEYECGTPADGNARYCTICGAPTTYYKEGLLKDWNEEHGNIRDKAKIQNKLTAI